MVSRALRHGFSTLGGAWSLLSGMSRNDIECPCCHRRSATHICSRCRERFCFRCSLPNNHVCTPVPSRPAPKRSPRQMMLTADLVAVVGHEELVVCPPKLPPPRILDRCEECDRGITCLCGRCRKYLCNEHRTQHHCVLGVAHGVSPRCGIQYCSLCRGCVA